MKYKKFNITDREGKSNCIIRSFCKLFNEEYDNIYKELVYISKKLNCNSYNDIEVFETYIKNCNMISILYDKDIKIKDLKLDNSSYIIFCWDKKEFYHMVSVINNIVYDKNNKCLDLYVIKIYRKR